MDRITTGKNAPGSDTIITIRTTVKCAFLCCEYKLPGESVRRDKRYGQSSGRTPNNKSENQEA